MKLFFAFLGAVLFFSALCFWILGSLGYFDFFSLLPIRFSSWARTTILIMMLVFGLFFAYRANAGEGAETHHPPTQSKAIHKGTSSRLLATIKHEEGSGQFRVTVNKSLTNDLFIGVQVATVTDEGFEKTLRRFSAVILKGSTESRMFDTQEWNENATVVVSLTPFEEYRVSGLPCYIPTIGRDVLNKDDPVFQPYQTGPKAIVAV